LYVKAAGSAGASPCLRRHAVRRDTALLFGEPARTRRWCIRPQVCGRGWLGSAAQIRARW